MAPLQAMREALLTESDRPQKSIIRHMRVSCMYRCPIDRLRSRSIALNGVAYAAPFQ